MTTTMKDIQSALASKGFDPGPIDGVFGARTRLAVVAFQTARGLAADGVVGPKTLASLFPVGSTAVSPEVQIPWLAEASRLMGLREGAGAANNPVILDWADDLDLAYSGDDVPWCGLFVAHCMAATLPNEPLPANLLAARQWLNFGVKVAPQLGAVMVFWRGSRDGWQGHVALYAGEDATAYYVVGGNQSDSVSKARIAKDRLLGARWPSLVPALGIVKSTGVVSSQTLSTNEA